MCRTDRVPHTSLTIEPSCSIPVLMSEKGDEKCHKETWQNLPISSLVLLPAAAAGPSSSMGATPFVVACELAGGAASVASAG